MRYTRNRQLRKINSLMASPFTLTIEDSKTHIWDDKLDLTFKWHHDFVWEIEKYWESYITLGTYGHDDFKIIPIK